jgi:hypothetical protein
VSAYCNYPGNEEADKLAKQGGALQQEYIGTTYEVAKIILKTQVQMGKRRPSSQKR